MCSKTSRWSITAIVSSIPAARWKSPRPSARRLPKFWRRHGALTLGGDHFITWPLLQAHAAKHGPLSIIQFDAHTDTWADEGERLDHGTMLWHAIHEGLVVPSRSAQIGIRSHNDDPMGVNIFNAIEVHKQGPEAIAKKVREIVGDNPVYVTFDIDCLDPLPPPARAHRSSVG